jgi:hypothetical protein
MLTSSGFGSVEDCIRYRPSSSEAAVGAMLAPNGQRSGVT